MYKTKKPLIIFELFTCFPKPNPQVIPRIFKILSCFILYCTSLLLCCTLFYCTIYPIPFTCLFFLAKFVCVCLSECEPLSAHVQWTSPPIESSSCHKIPVSPLTCSMISWFDEWERTTTTPAWSEWVRGRARAPAPQRRNESMELWENDQQRPWLVQCHDGQRPHSRSCGRRFAAFMQPELSVCVW